MAQLGRALAWGARGRWFKSSRADHPFFLDFKEIQESPLVLEGKEVAFHCSVISIDNLPLGSGFALSTHKARQIALNETIERRLVENSIASPVRFDLLLDEYPTSCGFAVGDCREATKERALAEAVERWLRSKWIDEGYTLGEAALMHSELSPLERHFVSFFKQLRLFFHTCYIDFEGKQETVNSVVVVGFTERGAFVGSKSMVRYKAPLLPALVEAWRHLQIALQDDDRMPETAIVKYFAQNKEVALQQIDKARKKEWPMPTVRLSKEVFVPIEGLYCFRVLCHDHRGWHGQDITRFVY